MILRVLIVEDDPAQAKILATKLESFGYKAAIAANGDEAIELAASREYNVAIVDWQLGPGSMTGKQVGRWLRRLGLATFLCSAYSRERIRREFRDPMEGFLAFFEKPIRAEELLDALLRVEKSHEDTEP